MASSGMLKTKLLVSVATAVSVLCACADIKPRETPKDLPVTEQAARAQMEPGWTDPAITRDGAPTVVVTTPMVPPEAMQRHQIKLELEDGATVRDVAAVLSNLGYSVVIADKTAANAEVMVPKYHGSLGGLLRSLQKAADVWFTWNDGAIVISSSETVEISLPQEQKLAERIAKGLVAYGFKKDETPVSAEAGIVSLKLRPSTYVAVRNYLTRITQNAALVNLQVALINVQLTQDASQGFDWTKMQIAVNGGHKNLLQTLDPTTGSSLNSNSTANNSATTTSTGTTTGSTTGSTSTVAANPTNTNSIANVSPNGSVLTTTTNGGTPSSTVLPNTGLGYLISNGSVRGVISNAAFSMIGFVNFLETYGTAKTVQSVMLRTVTGRQVEMKSVTKIPYVSNIGVGGGYNSNYPYSGTNGNNGSSGNATDPSNLSGFGDTSNNGNNGSNGSGTNSNGGLNNAYGGYNGLLGSANTSTANDGITLKLLPAYDEASETVTVELALSLEAVLSFNTLSAGNQIGSLSQPTTAQQTFNDTLRVRPGQTVVVGGLTYDSIKRDNAVPLFLPDKAKNSSLSIKRQAMFIVVRPTVTVLGALKDENAQLFAPAPGDDRNSAEEAPTPAAAH